MNAAKAIQDYEAYIMVLKSVHKDVNDTIDWQAIANEQAPVAPSPSDQHEQTAKLNLLGFQPSFMDKMFGFASKIKRLKEAVVTAKQKDNLQFEHQQKAYDKELADWKAIQEISKGVLLQDEKAYHKVFDFFKPFAEIAELGSEMSIIFRSHNITVDIKVNNEQVVPNYILSQTSKGKLSKKSMPVSKFNELYQDYICSCILRIAREALAYLPIDLVVINAMANLLNSATGRLEDQAILSVSIYRDSLDQINFDAIDPSDSMRNFVHNMKFSKTTGFSPVEKIDANALMRN